MLLRRGHPPHQQAQSRRADGRSTRRRSARLSDRSRVLSGRDRIRPVFRTGAINGSTPFGVCGVSFICGRLAGRRKRNFTWTTPAVIMKIEKTLPQGLQTRGVVSIRIPRGGESGIPARAAASGRDCRRTYHPVARVGEIVGGTRSVRRSRGNSDRGVPRSWGTYYAIDDACPHQGAPLSDGIVFDKSVTCSWHGWRFSLEDGCWLDSPRSRTRVGTHPVRVVDDEQSEGFRFLTHRRIPRRRFVHDESRVYRRNRPSRGDQGRRAGRTRNRATARSRSGSGPPRSTRSICTSGRARWPCRSSSPTSSRATSRGPSRRSAPRRPLSSRSATGFGARTRGSWAGEEVASPPSLPPSMKEWLYPTPALLPDDLEAAAYGRLDRHHVAHLGSFLRREPAQASGETVYVPERERRRVGSMVDPDAARRRRGHGRDLRRESASESDTAGRSEAEPRPQL